MADREWGTYVEALRKAREANPGVDPTGIPWPGWSGVRYGPNHHKKTHDEVRDLEEEVGE